MRFYTGAHEYILGTRFAQHYEDKLLFLVPEFDSKYDLNAIMLHNGRQKLASVSAEDAAKLKPAFEQHIGQVLLCNTDSFSQFDAAGFKRLASLTLFPKQWADERAARKYASLIHSKKEK